MATKVDHILNLKALAAEIKKPENTNAYHRLNLIVKGGDFAATPELLDEIEEVLKVKHKEFLAFIAKVRKGITIEEPVKKTA